MSSQHTDPAGAVKIHRHLRAAHSLGIHWGTFEMGSTEVPLSRAAQREEEEDIAALPGAAGGAGEGGGGGGAARGPIQDHAHRPHLATLISSGISRVLHLPGFIVEFTGGIPGFA